MNKNLALANLVDFGLSRSEASLYHALLELEQGSVDKIARAADTNRTSAYPILERLQQLGLVSRHKKGGKTVYRAAAPDSLLRILDEKRTKIDQSLPYLKSLFDLGEGRPTVALYEGVEGLKTVLNTILEEARSEILIFADGESFLKKIPGWTEDYLLKRARRQLRSRIVVKGTPYNIKAAQEIRAGRKTESAVTKIRVLPEAYRLNYGGFDVYNNKTVFYSFDKQSVAVVLESKIIADLMRTAYEILWQEAGRYEQLLK